MRYLEGLARKSKDKVSDKISHLMELYKTRKIPQMTTIEKLILSLRSPGQRLVSKASKQNDALAAEYEDAEPHAWEASETEKRQGWTQSSPEQSKRKNN